MRDSHWARDPSRSCIQDNIAPGSIALSFVSNIVKSSFALLLPTIFVSETLVFSIFPSHDTLVVEGVAVMVKIIIVIRRVSLIVGFVVFIYGYPQ